MSNLSNDKKTKKEIRQIPPKEAKTVPWQKLCIDLVGSYKIPIKAKNKKSKNNTKPSGASLW